MNRNTLVAGLAIVVLTLAGVVHAESLTQSTSVHAKSVMDQTLVNIFPTQGPDDE